MWYVLVCRIVGFGGGHTLCCCYIQSPDYMKLLDMAFLQNNYTTAVFAQLARRGDNNSVLPVPTMPEIPRSRRNIMVAPADGGGGCKLEDDGDGVELLPTTQQVVTKEERRKRQKREWHINRALQKKKKIDIEEVQD